MHLQQPCFATEHAALQDYQIALLVFSRSSTESSIVDEQASCACCCSFLLYAESGAATSVSARVGPNVLHRALYFHRSMP